jgi:redox-sensing transcriptional repressor
VKTEGIRSIYSHQIAVRAGVSPAQVRRDLMAVGYSGSPNRGYEASELLHSIEDFLYDPVGQNVALVGIGNLGRAILAFFSSRRRRLNVVAAFDTDPAKVNQVVHGCRSYPMHELPRVIHEQDIRVAIITVPADAAQGVAEQLVEAGVRGLLNFAPVTLRCAAQVYVEHMDLSVSLEKVAFFARRRLAEGRKA